MNFKKKLLIFILLSIYFVIPFGVAYAQTTVNENSSDGAGIPGYIIPDPSQPIGQVGIVNELYEAHSDVTDIMIADQTGIVNEDIRSDDIFIQATYVDEKNQKLVVWLDPYHLFDPIDVEDLKEELGIDVPIVIKIGFFMPDSHTSSAPNTPSTSYLHCPVSNTTQCYIWDRYVQNCLSGTTPNYCASYRSLLVNTWNLVPPTSTASPTTTPPPTNPTTQSLPDGVVFQDDFENGFGQWIKSGQDEWEIGPPDDNILVPGSTASNNVAKADDCDDRACIITMSAAVNLSSYSSAILEFDRFVDRGLDTSEYLKVQVGNNGQYADVFNWTHRNGDDHTWHHETLNLSDYLSSGFKVRILTEQSSSSEDINIDNVIINVDSITECVLTVASQLQDDHDSVITNWNNCGDDIDRYYVYTSRDGGSDRLIRVVTSGTSYEYFGISEGSSYVFKVKARYAEDSSFTELFTGPTVSIPVVDRTAPVIATQNLTVDATSENGSIVTYSTSAYDGVDGSRLVICSPPSGSNFSVGTTTVTCTATDSSGNLATETFIVTVNAFVPGECQIGNRTYTDRDICATAQSVDVGLLEFLKQHGVLGDPEIFGGSVFTIHREHPFDYNVATSGLVITDSNGTNKLLTNEHNIQIANGMSDRIKIHTLLHPFGVQIGSIDTQAGLLEPNNKNGTADAGLITITSESIIAHPNQIRYNNESLNVTSFGGVEQVTNLPIYIASRSGDRQGELIVNNATAVISYSGVGDRILTHQSVGYYRSIIGDSGAPIFTRSGNNATLLGLHFAAGCSGITLENGTELACTDRYPEYNLFSPWENISTRLNIP